MRMRWKQEVRRIDRQVKSGGLLEGEFAFAAAVGDFLHEEAGSGTFKGDYLLT